jgi:acetyl-CoA carboxylase biotin carboxylase subunit
MWTGLDLVAHQLRIAASCPLDLKQSKVGFQGHAIEFRINAEDPAQGFRPDPGRIEQFRPPQARGAGVTVRWDSAVRKGYRIPPNYDSMIGKLIAHGDTRATAIARMRNALAELVIEGINSNKALHQEILSHAAFQEGGLDIHYLERRLGLK